MIRQVGLFKFLKNNYDSDEDLKDLEEIVYEDEHGFRNKRSINDMIHSYQGVRILAVIIMMIWKKNYIRRLAVMHLLMNPEG